MLKLKSTLLISIFSIIFSFSTPIYSSNLNIILNKKVNFDIPEESGQTYNMPWINDNDFLEAKEVYDTPILIAGFCSVLVDPLPGEEYNVALAAKSISGHVVKPSKIFSQNERIGPYTKRRGYKDGSSFAENQIVTTEGGGVCKIATSLYNLAVLSNLEIVERYFHSMPVNYVPYGQDATVAYGIKDFRFKNTTEGNILIWSELIGNRLYMGFYGSKRPPKVTWTHEVTDIVKPSLKYIRNTSLAKGEMVLKIKGIEGANVKSIITIEYSDGAVETKKMSPSYYFPLPEVIEIN
ncbi:MAG: VanW family protein [Tissierellia bacterium]|nr:VanW family protein [Tissierellia bacterium]MDD4725967.1 VanW family protein [Tissierellia bacterium]